MKSGMVSAWLRLLTVQASWNYYRLVGIGAAFSGEPLLRDLPGGVDGERYRTALARSTQVLNGHPYLIGLAVGAVARSEYEGVPAGKMDRLRTALAGPLGAVGDRVVWAGALPVASAVGLMLAVLVGPLVGVVAFLALYNLAHMALRVWALRAGWRGGMLVGRELGGAGIKLSMRIAGPAAAFTVGLALPLVGAWLSRGLDQNAVIGMAVVASLGIAFARWLWPSLGALRFCLGAVLVAVLVGWL